MIRAGEICMEAKKTLTVRKPLRIFSITSLVVMTEEAFPSFHKRSAD